MYSYSRHVCLIYAEARREYQIFWNGSYRQLWDVKWMLGIKPGSFERIGSSCKCWAISTDPVCQYQIYKFCIYVHHENRSSFHSLCLEPFSSLEFKVLLASEKEFRKPPLFFYFTKLCEKQWFYFFQEFCRIQQFFRIWSLVVFGWKAFCYLLLQS